LIYQFIPKMAQQNKSSLFPLFILLMIGVIGSGLHAQSWVQRGIDLDGEAADDESGRSISLSADGSILAIGAYHNCQTGTWAGHVRIYEWNGSSWLQKGSDIDGENNFDFSGYSVGLSADGTTVVTGEYGSHAGGNSRGKVRVFQWNGSSWAQKGLDFIGNDYDEMGNGGVALNSDGNTVAFAAPSNAGIPNANGYVEIYAWNGSAWIQKGATIFGENDSDESGFSISLSSDGNTIAIGAHLNDGTGTNAGHVRIYSWNGSSWLQKGSDIDGEAAFDRSGASVSLSSDGNIVGIGAPINDGSGAGEGHARVYNWNGSSWIQKGNDLIGETGGENFGHSVSLSSDGNTIAVGGPFNDGSGTQTGSAHVYTWNGSSWIQKGIDIDGENGGDYSGLVNKSKFKW
jgi:hypothetical protein